MKHLLFLIALVSCSHVPVYKSQTPPAGQAVVLSDDSRRIATLYPDGRQIILEPWAELTDVAWGMFRGAVKLNDELERCKNPKPGGIKRESKLSGKANSAARREEKGH